jgi:hypothetical protein
LATDQDLRVSYLSDYPLQLHVIHNVIGHDRQVLLPWKFPELQIQQKINERFNIVPGAEFAPHYLVVRSEIGRALKICLLFCRLLVGHSEPVIYEVERIIQLIIGSHNVLGLHVPVHIPYLMQGF